MRYTAALSLSVVLASSHAAGGGSAPMSGPNAVPSIAPPAADQAPGEGLKTLSAVPFTAVRFTDDFWAPRLKTTRERTVRHNIQQCEQTARVENLRLAGAGKGGTFQGYLFNDSDVYKVIEGAAYQLAQAHDEQLDKQVDELIAVIAAAQQPDGYLDSYYTLKVGLDKKFTNEAHDHETYCAGHLIEAAVAHYQATGKRSLLDVAIKLADHLAGIFGPGKRAEAPGHEEIELALVKLWRVTGDQKYFDLAKFFIECRGVPRPTARNPKGELYGEYCQDQLPVRQQTEVVGHAVRAMYLFSGVSDIAAVTGDQGYIDAMHWVWEDLTQRKMYVTGGIGPSGSNEGFTFAYDLPNETAYAESCAAIGLALWAERLNLLHADAAYFDTYERALYNGLLSSISLSGDRYFYVNPLASKGGHHRQEWFGCACCPPNILRVLSSLGGSMYATRGADVFVNLYAGSQASVKIGESAVTLKQETKYPWDGKVRLTAGADQTPKNASILVRIPGWCRGASIKVNGEATPMPPIVKGYARVPWVSGKGLVIDLDLPMPVERVYSDPRVLSNTGRAALQRGPVVYCLEAADNPAGVWNLAIAPTAALSSEFRPDLLGGVAVLRGQALAVSRDAWPDGSLYTSRPSPVPVEFTAVPYFAWDNRSAGEMAVWIAETPAVLLPTPKPDQAVSVSYCSEDGTPDAITDGREPKNSQDLSIPRQTFWNHNGTSEWAQIEFKRPRIVSSSSVYWFDDISRGGGCAVPKVWRVLYRDGKDWKPAKTDAAPGCAPDTFNGVKFDPVRTDALRLEIQLQPGRSAGILEWRVDK